MSSDLKEHVRKFSKTLADLIEDSRDVFSPAQVAVMLLTTGVDLALTYQPDEDAREVIQDAVAHAYKMHKRGE